MGKKLQECGSGRDKKGSLLTKKTSPMVFLLLIICCEAGESDYMQRDQPTLSQIIGHKLLFESLSLSSGSRLYRRLSEGVLMGKHFRAHFGDQNFFQRKRRQKYGTIASGEFLESKQCREATSKETRLDLECEIDNATCSLEDVLPLCAGDECGHQSHSTHFSARAIKGIHQDVETPKQRGAQFGPGKAPSQDGTSRINRKNEEIVNYFAAKFSKKTMNQIQQENKVNINKYLDIYGIPEDPPPMAWCSNAEELRCHSDSTCDFQGRVLVAIPFSEHTDSRAHNNFSQNQFSANLSQPNSQRQANRDVPTQTAMSPLSECGKYDHSFFHSKKFGNIGAFVVDLPFAEEELRETEQLRRTNAGKRGAQEYEAVSEQEQRNARNEEKSCYRVEKIETDSAIIYSAIISTPIIRPYLAAQPFVRASQVTCACDRASSVCTPTAQWVAQSGFQSAQNDEPKTTSTYPQQGPKFGANNWLSTMGGTTGSGGIVISGGKVMAGAQSDILVSDAKEWIFESFTDEPKYPYPFECMAVYTPAPNNFASDKTSATTNSLKTNSPKPDSAEINSAQNNSAPNMGAEKEPTEMEDEQMILKEGCPVSELFKFRIFEPVVRGKVIFSFSPLVFGGRRQHQIISIRCGMRLYERAPSVAQFCEQPIGLDLRATGQEPRDGIQNLERNQPSGRRILSEGVAPTISEDPKFPAHAFMRRLNLQPMMGNRVRKNANSFAKGKSILLKYSFRKNISNLTQPRRLSLRNFSHLRKIGHQKKHFSTRLNKLATDSPFPPEVPDFGEENFNKEFGPSSISDGEDYAKSDNMYKAMWGYSQGLDEGEVLEPDLTTPVRSENRARTSIDYGGRSGLGNVSSPQFNPQNEPKKLPPGSFDLEGLETRGRSKVDESEKFLQEVNNTVVYDNWAVIWGRQNPSRRTRLQAGNDRVFAGTDINLEQRETKTNVGVGKNVMSFSTEENGAGVGYVRGDYGVKVEATERLDDSLVEVVARGTETATLMDYVGRNYGQRVKVRDFDFSLRHDFDEDVDPHSDSLATEMALFYKTLGVSIGADPADTRYGVSVGARGATFATERDFDSRFTRFKGNWGNGWQTVFQSDFTDEASERVFAQFGVGRIGKAYGEAGVGVGSDGRPEGTAEVQTRDMTAGVKYQEYEGERRYTYSFTAGKFSYIWESKIAPENLNIPVFIEP